MTDPKILVASLAAAFLYVVSPGPAFLALFGRVLVKFIGTHGEYDRIDPETVSWRGR